MDSVYHVPKVSIHLKIPPQNASNAYRIQNVKEGIKSLWTEDIGEILIFRAKY